MRRIISLIVGMAMALLVSVAVAPAAHAHVQTWYQGNDWGWVEWGGGTGPNHYKVGATDRECDGHRFKVVFRWLQINQNTYYNDQVIDENGCGETAGWYRSVYDYGTVRQVRLCEETDAGNWTCLPSKDTWYGVSQDMMA